jgi:hypothetical protein
MIVFSQSLVAASTLVELQLNVAQHALGDFFICGCRTHCTVTRPSVDRTLNWAR